MNRARAFAIAALFAFAGCGGSVGRDETAPDAGFDAGPDAGAAAGCCDGSSPDGGGADAGPRGREVKVMIVNMAFLEGQGFIDALGLDRKVAVDGLYPGAREVLCNAAGVCQVTIGMGYANAAASMTALLFRSGLDLSRAYFIIAGIGGVDPAKGTIGSAAWARWVVDHGFAHEIDAREMPEGWPYGYFGVGAASPPDPPSNDYTAAVFRLDDGLVAAAYALSKDAVLEDSPAAQRFRKNFPEAPANQPPKVIVCDVVSSDTWFGGTALNLRARDWTLLLTGGDGDYCMSAQEDNATLEVLSRGAAAEKIDMARVAVLRAASDFASPYEGQTDADSLVNSMEQGGLSPSTANLYRAAGPLMAAIVADWPAWRNGVPPGLTGAF